MNNYPKYKVFKEEGDLKTDTGNCIIVLILSKKGDKYNIYTYENDELVDISACKPDNVNYPGFDDITEYFDYEDILKMTGSYFNQDEKELIIELKNLSNDFGRLKFKQRITTSSRVIKKFINILDELNEENNGIITPSFIKKFNTILYKVYSNIPKIGVLLRKNSEEDIFKAATNPNKVKQCIEQTRRSLEDAYNTVLVFEEEYEAVKQYLDSNGIHIYTGDSYLENLCKELKCTNFKCWYIVNDNTEAKYQQRKHEVKGIHQREKMLMHGSPGQNWLKLIAEGFKYGAAGADNAVGTPGDLGFGFYFGLNNYSSYKYDSGNGKNYKGIFKCMVGNTATGAEATVKIWNAMYSFPPIIKNIKEMAEFLEKNGFDSISSSTELSIPRSDQITIYALVEQGDTYMMD